MKRALGVLATAAVLAACSASTEGTGAPGTRALVATPTATPTTSTVTGFPSSAQLSPPNPSTTTTTLPSTIPTSGATPVDVTGTVSRNHYAITVWATSKVTDCAAHAYGTRLVNEFEQHPCRSATRRLISLPAADGRTIAMSTIVVVCAPGTSTDPYRYVGRLVTLERADNTGSMNDLLREGIRPPGFPTKVPADEAFSVQSQDSVVTVFDAWYTPGATPVQAPELINLEEDLMLTQVTVP